MNARTSKGLHEVIDDLTRRLDALDQAVAKSSADRDARVRKLALAAVAERFPHWLAPGLEPLVDAIVALETLVEAEGKNTKAALESVRASAGAAAIEARNAASANATAAREHMLGRVHSFVFGNA